MLSPEELTLISKTIANAANDYLGKTLKRVILYGSYARGDFDDESDIDIMLVADIKSEDCYSVRKYFSELLTALGIEYDVLISLHVQDVDTFNKWRNVVPFYMNVEREGVVISA